MLYKNRHSQMTVMTNGPYKYNQTLQNTQNQQDETNIQDDVVFGLD